MTNCYFSELLIARIPLWPSSFAERQAEDILADIFFRNAIKLASDSFYGLLLKKGFDAALLSQKESAALQHYINRICYRPTPFGLFAGCGLTGWKKQTGLTVLDGRLDIITDLAAYYRKSNTIDPADGLKLFSNPTLYKHKNTWRYVKAVVYEKETTYEQCTCADLPPLSKTIRFCSRPKEYKNVLAMLLDYGNTYDEVNEYIQSLLHWGILLHDRTPNMTGELYHQRMGAEDEPKSFTATQLHEPQAVLEAQQYGIYSLSLSGGVGNGIREKMLNVLNACAKWQPQRDPTALEAFRKSFMERFDRQAVPLLQALDPVLGIDYAGLAALKDDDPAKDIEGPVVKKQTALHPFQAYILNKLLGAERADRFAPLCLSLADMDLPVNPPDPFPPGMHVLFRIVDKQLFLEQAGGVSGTSVAGRFTLFNPQLLRKLKRIARAEEKANPGVVFAEVAYYNDEHAANVNLRRHIRQYEIPLMTTPVKGVRRIGLNELEIFIDHGQIVLFSSRLGKRIMPVLGTAYNFNRAELPLFRFLCDLSYQGAAGNILPSLQEIVPGLAFYPRLVIDGIVISLAKWMFTGDQLRQLLQHDDQVGRFLRQYHLPRYVSIRKHDQEIVLDSLNGTFRQDLLGAARGLNTITIQEFPAGDTSCKDRHGRSYQCQFLASLISTYPAYSPVLPPEKDPGVKRVYAPLNDWVYYKLYCHPLMANEILLTCIYPAFLQKRNRVKTWFFIRYNDPDHHLRIRAKGDAVMRRQLEKVASWLLEQGYCSSIKIDTYERELERYLPHAIDKAEYLFGASSDSYCSFAQGGDFSTGLLLAYAIAGADLFIRSAGMDDGQAAGFCKRMGSYYFAEAKGDKSMKLKLDEKARQHKHWHALANNEWFGANFRACATDYFKCVKESAPDKLNDTLASMIHMHLNRCFAARQRLNELVVYHILERYYHSRLKRV